MNRELPDVQARFRKGRGTRDQTGNIHWSTEKARKFQKTPTSASLTTLTPLIVWIKANCGKFLKRWELPDHFFCLLRNLCVGQEATVRTLYGTTDWLKIGKGIQQGCILSTCLFNLYCRAHHRKCQVRWITSWNQDCQEKYQQPQICRWWWQFRR